MSMIELDVYFYCYLGETLCKFKSVSIEWPVYFKLKALSDLRETLSSFNSGTDRARAFSETALVAQQIMFATDAIFPNMPASLIPPLELTKETLEQVQLLCVKLEEKLHEEADRAYILRVEGQGPFSAYVLVEKIEQALAEKTWKYLSREARREIEESGKCLSVERFTSSGFHVLRCVESVIREYIKALKITLKDSERNWGVYVRYLRENGAAQEVANIVDTMRVDDRNTLMHPEKFLEKDDAVGLFCLSRTALDRLINDLDKRGLATEFRPVTAP